MSDTNTIGFPVHSPQADRAPFLRPRQSSSPRKQPSSASAREGFHASPTRKLSPIQVPDSAPAESIPSSSTQPAPSGVSTAVSSAYQPRQRVTRKSSTVERRDPSPSNRKSPKQPKGAVSFQKSQEQPPMVHSGPPPPKPSESPESRASTPLTPPPSTSPVKSSMSGDSPMNSPLEPADPPPKGKKKRGVGSAASESRAKRPKLVPASDAPESNTAPPQAEANGKKGGRRERPSISYSSTPSTHPDSPEKRDSRSRSPIKVRLNIGPTTVAPSTAKKLGSTDGPTEADDEDEGPVRRAGRRPGRPKGKKRVQELPPSVSPPTDRIAPEASKAESEGVPGDLSLEKPPDASMAADKPTHETADTLANRENTPPLPPDASEPSKKSTSFPKITKKKDDSTLAAPPSRKASPSATSPLPKAPLTSDAKKLPSKKPPPSINTPNKSSVVPLSLLNSTMALLTGKKDKPRSDKPKTDAPKAVKKGAWTDEWALTDEQEAEYEASATQRAAERAIRDSWIVDAINLQEAKDAYRLDSYQPRAFSVEGVHGVFTTNKPSEILTAMLQT